jgi:hypothetical protein
MQIKTELERKSLHLSSVQENENMVTHPSLTTMYIHTYTYLYTVTTRDLIQYRIEKRISIHHR